MKDKTMIIHRVGRSTGMNFEQYKKMIELFKSKNFDDIKITFEFLDHKQENINLKKILNECLQYIPDDAINLTDFDIIENPLKNKIKNILKENI